MDILYYEKKYCRSIKGLYKILEKCHSSAVSNANISLRKKDVTKAIILRMMTHYKTQYKVKHFLNKQLVGAASDIFVETVIYYLKLLFEQRNIDLTICSEIKLKPKTGIIRPDISIWKDDKVIAIIECKTNLGWIRKTWEKDFLRREKKLKRINKTASAYLLILSSINGPGFDPCGDRDDDRVGTQYFSLSNQSIRKLTFKKIDEAIESRIEDLFSQIIKVYKEHK